MWVRTWDSPLAHTSAGGAPCPSGGPGGDWPTALGAPASAGAWCGLATAACSGRTAAGHGRPVAAATANAAPSTVVAPALCHPMRSSSSRLSRLCRPNMASPGVTAAGGPPRSSSARARQQHGQASQGPGLCTRGRYPGSKTGEPPAIGQGPTSAAPRHRPNPGTPCPPPRPRMERRCCELPRASLPDALCVTRPPCGHAWGGELPCCQRCNRGPQRR